MIRRILKRGIAFAMTLTLITSIFVVQSDVVKAETQSAYVEGNHDGNYYYARATGDVVQVFSSLNCQNSARLELGVHIYVAGGWLGDIVDEINETATSTGKSAAHTWYAVMGKEIYSKCQYTYFMNNAQIETQYLRDFISHSNNKIEQSEENIAEEDIAIEEMPEMEP